MPKATPTIPVAPEVLVWARESAGLSEVELGRKIGAAEINVLEWERPDTATLVTPIQLEKIADAVKRPTAALLLDAPLGEPPPPKDFRRADRRQMHYSSDLSMAIRRARRLQKIAAEVFGALGEPVALDLPAAFSVADDVEQVASQVRNALGIPDDMHRRWQNVYTALRGWRAIVESRNVLVFSGDFPRNEAQGFSLSEAQPNAIMLSAKDSPSARCFTLWHEFGHLLLRNTGLCVTDEPVEKVADHDRRTEDWCNRFSEALLVDGVLLQSRSQTAAVAKRSSGYESALKTLASHFKVSQHVALFRMRHLGLIPESMFREEFARVQAEQEEAARKSKKRGGPPDPANIAVRDSGQRLAKALLQAFDRDVLTHANLADYFGVRLKHLDNIRREAHRQ